LGIGLCGELYCNEEPAHFDLQKQKVLDSEDQLLNIKPFYQMN
jgi:hypothetical protein